MPAGSAREVLQCDGGPGVCHILRLWMSALRICGVSQEVHPAGWYFLVTLVTRPGSSVLIKRLMRARGSFSQSSLSKSQVSTWNWRWGACGVAVAPRSSKRSILAAIAFSASFILSISRSSLSSGGSVREFFMRFVCLVEGCYVQSSYSRNTSVYRMAKRSYQPKCRATRYITPRESLLSRVPCYALKHYESHRYLEGVLPLRWEELVLYQILGAPCRNEAVARLGSALAALRCHG